MFEALKIDGAYSIDNCNMSPMAKFGPSLSLAGGLCQYLRVFGAPLSKLSPEVPKPLFGDSKFQPGRH